MDGGKSSASWRSMRTPSLNPHACRPFPPNLQDLLQLLLRVNHDDVGTAVIGDVLAGLRGAGCVDAGDNATAGDQRLCVWAGADGHPSAQPPGPWRSHGLERQGSHREEMGCWGGGGVSKDRKRPSLHSAHLQPLQALALPVTHPANTVPTAEKNHSGELKPRMATLCAGSRPSSSREDRPGQSAGETPNTHPVREGPGGQSLSSPCCPSQGLPRASDPQPSTRPPTCLEWDPNGKHLSGAWHPVRAQVM